MAVYAPSRHTIPSRWHTKPTMAVIAIALIASPHVNQITSPSQRLSSEGMVFVSAMNTIEKFGIHTKIERSTKKKWIWSSRSEGVEKDKADDGE